MALNSTEDLAATEEKNREEQGQVAFWIDEINEARKREKDYREAAKEVLQILECDDPVQAPFNILYSNTETLQAVLYNSAPRPTAKRRFNDKDLLAKTASTVITRFLEYFIDANDNAESDFDEMMRVAVFEALAPGRGITRFSYIADITKAQDGQTEQIQNERVIGEEIPWNLLHFGYAKRWAAVPWIAFEHYMSREDLISNFGEIGRTIPLTIAEEKGNKTNRTDEEDTPSDIGSAMLARVYEIWDKTKKQVLFICAEHKDAPLKESSDPYGLQGFFPIPRPLIFSKKSTSLTPVPLYSFYREQAEELNAITLRIKYIIKALKVRGFYDNSIDGLSGLMQADDNTLLPADNVAAMHERGGLEKALWFMPIEKLINVLQQLYVQRDQVKRIIYEITAIADIMRGATAASETLGAQELKSQWGSLRIRRFQKEAQRYVRDCLRLVTELAFTKLSPDTIKQIVGIQLPTREQKQQVQQQIAQAQGVLQQAQLTGQSVPPQAAQQVAAQTQKAQQLLTIPDWESVFAVLSDDLLRNYKIDIETNSTVDAEATEDKKDVAEFLNALAQFLNGALPLTQSGVLPFEAMKSIMGAVTRKFRFGVEVEEELEKMQQPKQQTSDPAAEAKVAAEKQKMQIESEKHKIEMQQQQQEMQLKTAQQQQELQLQSERQRMEMQLAAAEHELKLIELQRKAQLNEQKFAMQLRQMQMKQATIATTPTKETENKKEEE